jgi:hypothetical protein
MYPIHTCRHEALSQAQQGEKNESPVGSSHSSLISYMWYASSLVTLSILSLSFIFDSLIYVFVLSSLGWIWLEIFDLIVPVYSYFP